jgi:single-strand DNA-binding protein
MISEQEGAPMAFHKLVLIGKLVSDPKANDFANGGRVAKFGLPVNFTRPKKNPVTGEWEGESFIINVDVFNRDNFKLADMVMQSLRKGSQVYVEGRLRNNEYTDRNNVKVARPVLVADVLEFLDGRGDGGSSVGTGDGMMRASPPAAAPSRAPAPAAYQGDSYDTDPGNGSPSRHGGGGGGGEEDIPF